MTKRLITSFLFTILTTVHAQPLTFSGAIASERSEQERVLREEAIHKTFNGRLSPETAPDWETAFWAMELMQVKDSFALGAVKRAYTHLNTLSPAFQRAWMEVVYTLFPSEFLPEMSEIANRTTHEKLFAMAVQYVTRLQPQRRLFYLQKIQKTFGRASVNPIIHMLRLHLEGNTRPHTISKPAWKDLLTHSFRPDETIIFSFQRHNRDFPGRTIIRKPNGQFVQDENGQLFSIPHLARAVTNLPGYITNGNSPQGILRWDGISKTDNSFIGPTEVLPLFLPYEIPESRFLPEKTDTTKTLTYQDYLSLWPKSWRKYVPIEEAYWAGKAGRYEIWAHGTTINPEFYPKTPFYPNTPSLGCLTASEIWSPQNGERLKSDQQAFITQLKKINKPAGYFILIELDDQQKPVEEQDVIRLVQLIKQK